MFRLSAIIAVLLLYTSAATAQIRIEYLSRTDSFPFLGAGSDNKVRLHNLPPAAHVNIQPGSAIRLNDSDFVLCRFIKGDAGRIIDDSAVYVLDGREATLTVSSNGKSIFRKEFRLFFTKPAGSIYNPEMPLRPLNLTIKNSGDHVIQMTKGSLDTTIAGGLLALSDTSCRIIGLFFSAVGGWKDMLGPDYIGNSSFLDGTSTTIDSFNQKTFNALLGKKLSSIHYSSGDRIFLESIKVFCPLEGSYSLYPKIIMVD